MGKFLYQYYMGLSISVHLCMVTAFAIWVSSLVRTLLTLIRLLPLTEKPAADDWVASGAIDAEAVARYALTHEVRSRDPLLAACGLSDGQATLSDSLRRALQRAAAAFDRDYARRQIVLKAAKQSATAALILFTGSVLFGFYPSLMGIGERMRLADGALIIAIQSVMALGVALGLYALLLLLCVSLERALSARRAAWRYSCRTILRGSNGAESTVGVGNNG